MMIERIKRFIHDNGLLDDGQQVTVALSGGADSVCLLRVLHSLGYRVEAAHCNFHLRGDESDRDTRFVRTLCDGLGVTLHVRHFDTLGEVRRTGKSIEMVAREQRYGWFAELGTTVAVAHHKNDNAETLLLNLFRGTGIAGMVGMRPRRVMESGLVVVRPLLCLTRREVERLLDGHPYVTDSTNNGDDALRNIIRHHVAQMEEAAGKDIVEAINTSARNMADAYRLYASAVEAAVKGCFDGTRIDMERLMATAAPATVLHEILSPCGFNAAQVEAILAERDGEAGRVYESPAWRLLRDRGCWLLRSRGERYELIETVVPLEGEVRVSRDVSLRVSRHPAAGYHIDRRRDVASFDLEKLQFPITVRLTADGDRFAPFGMKGTKLVSDYLTDLRRTVFDKERQLVLLSGDTIAWLVGERPSAMFAVDGSTRFVLRVEAIRLNDKL